MSMNIILFLRECNRFELNIVSNVMSMISFMFLKHVQEGAWERVGRAVSRGGIRVSRGEAR